MCCAQVYSRVLHHAKSGHAMVGACCWSIAHTSYPDYDGFTVYLGQGGAAAARQLPAKPAVQSDKVCVGASELEQEGSIETQTSAPLWEGSEGVSRPRKQRRPDADTLALIRQQAADMAALSSAADGNCAVM